VCVTLMACRDPGPPPPSNARVAEDAPALEALRAADFASAERLSAEQLVLSPCDSEAAAIHALASYAQTAQALYIDSGMASRPGAITALLDDAAKPAMVGFVDRLDAIDRDLQVASGDPQFSLELCVGCWQVDWNRDGRIDEREAQFLAELGPDGHELPLSDPRARPTYRFDVGDVSWARTSLALQRAAIDLLLAYRWNEVVDRPADRDAVAHLVAPDRVARARELLLAATGLADQTREAYLAEPDDDHEWVPNPRQHDHPVPLAVDSALYDRWATVTADARRLVLGEEGVPIRELAPFVFIAATSHAYIDVGAMLEHPTDIVVPRNPASVEALLRSVLGNGYRDSMRPSPIVVDMGATAAQLESIAELKRKLRYLVWLN